MRTVTCTVCGATADVPPEQGMQPDVPTDWGNLLIAQRGTKIDGALLCPACVANVRGVVPRAVTT